METVKQPSPSTYSEMYAERNSRLLCQGPASDRIHRFSGKRRMGMRSHCDNRATDQSLRGQPCRRSTDSDRRLPTGLPFRYDDVLESVAYEEGFPVISRLSARITPDSGNSITRQGISLKTLFDMSQTAISNGNGTSFDAAPLHVAMQM